MEAPDEELVQLRWDYHVIGAGHNDTALVIKQKYRALIKEWHQDRWAQEPEKFAQATRKMQDINAAYDRIQHAPLRYHISSHPRVQRRWEDRTQRRERADRPYRTQPPPDPDALRRVREDIVARARKRARAEYQVRFVLGVMGGLVMTWVLQQYMVLRWGEEAWPPVFGFAYIVLPLLCGWGNARYRDNFWSGVGESVYNWFWIFR